MVRDMINIYELMKSEEFKGNDISFIVDLESADCFIADVIDNDELELFEGYIEEEIEEILNENKEFIVSRIICDGITEYFIEPLFHGGKLFYLESDIIAIQKELIDIVDMNKLEGEIILLKDEVEKACNCCEHQEDDSDSLDTETLNALVELELTKAITCEELERMELFKEDYVVPKDKQTVLYLEGMNEVRAFVAMAKEMINKGNVDYNNSLSFISNFFTHKHNLELAKYNAVIQQQNQI